MLGVAKHPVAAEAQRPVAGGSSGAQSGTGHSRGTRVVLRLLQEIEARIGAWVFTVAWSRRMPR